MVSEGVKHVLSPLVALSAVALSGCATTTGTFDRGGSCNALTESGARYLQSQKSQLVGKLYAIYSKGRDSSPSRPRVLKKIETVRTETVDGLGFTVFFDGQFQMLNDVYIEQSRGTFENFVTLNGGVFVAGSCDVSKLSFKKAIFLK